MRNKKYKVIALHPYTKCNMNPPCPFCYKSKSNEEKPQKFWYDLVPYLKQLTNQVACVEENEFILVKRNGLILLDKIKNIKVNEIVLSSDGIFRKVINKKNEKKGEIYEIYCKGGKKIILTSEHKIPTNNGLKKVKELTTKDILFKGNKIEIKPIKKIDMLSETFRTKKGSKLRYNNIKIWMERSPHKIKRNYKITKYLTRLCGYYISEGDDRGFSFNKKELKRIADCKNCFKKVFKINLSERKNGENGIKLECGSYWIIPLLAHRFKLGKGAINKSIGIGFSFSERMIKELLKGIFGGDGWFNTKQDKRTKNKKTYSLNYNLITASLKLRNELLYLLECFLGVNCCISQEKGKKRKIEGREIINYDNTYYRISIYTLSQIKYLRTMFKYNENFNELYKIMVNQSYKMRYSKPIKKTERLKIIKILKKKGNFNVVDLTIENKPYFVCGNNILVHNCGGGEPFMDLEFVKKFGRLCKKNDLILNVTSNGRLLMDLSDKELRSVLKDITMVSLSFDSYKVKNIQDLLNYIKLVKRIKKLTKTQVGSNLLVDEKILETLIKTTDMLFRMGVDRVFALIMKNYPHADILKFKDDYQLLTLKYKMFFVDDASKCILEEGKYKNWCKSCHFFKEMISISENGDVLGCSFDDTALLKLKEPKDILKILNIKAEERFSCPYLKTK